MNVFCTSEIQKLYAKNNVFVKRYDILKICYPDETLLFGLNIAYSNCHNFLGKSAIDIWGSQEKCYRHFQRGISPLLIRIFKNSFHVLKGFIFYNNDNLYPMTTGIQG